VFYGRSVSAISAKHSKTLNKISLNTTISASQYQTNPNSNYRNMYSGIEPAYKYGYGSMQRVEEQIEWRINEKTNIVGGVVFENFFSLPESTDLQEPVKDNKSIEGVFLNTRSYYKPEGLAAKFYAVKYSNIGAYVQWQQKISPKFSLIAGTRFDCNTRFGSTLIPRAGVVVNPSKLTTVKVMAGTAYLAPTPGSSYSYYGTFYTLDSGRTYRSNFLHLPNPKLKPMISKNMEISLQQYIGNNFSFTLTGYYARVTNLINFAADDGNTNLYGGQFLGWDVDYIEVFVNQGLEETIGGSLQLAYNYNFHKGWLRAYSNFSFVDGAETIPGTMRKSELDNISPWMVKSGIDISWRDFYIAPRLILLSEQRLEGESDDDTRQTLPGYALLNISLGYKLNKISFFANITNALNQVYRATGPNMDLSNTNTELFHGNYQDPIRFNGGIKVSF
jgi:outer membrane receptor protein involved in Fe transport